MKHAERFFEYARERHAIHLRRVAGEPREQWTKDKILQKYRFTNVFRELDKTTKWFANYVREPLRNSPEVLLATVVFRMLNRIEVGEAVFCQRDLVSNETAFEEFLHTGKIGGVRSAIKKFVGPRGPYVTGAYIISSPPGYTKLDGVLKVISDFNKKSGWQEWVSNDPRSNECSLKAAWEWLREQSYLGNFHSYEIVTDLRWTALLSSASDIMTWANVGPGARRGANRVWGRDKKEKTSSEQVVEEMCALLRLSQDTNYWPKDWPAWELRDVEHTLCEFDKYERVRKNEGRPRGVYK